MSFPTLIRVTEASQVGEARRATTALAGRLGFSEAACGNAALVATEAATNLVKHAREGVFLLRPLENEDRLGMEILALDRGPGMADVSRCLPDGFSTAGTPGSGFGAISRQSSFFDVYSRPEVGTAVLARLWAAPPTADRQPRFQAAAVSVPKSGETVCGDAWSADPNGSRIRLLIADGLGHGPDAGQAAQLAVRVFRENARLGPAECLRTMHAALRSTRGAAVAAVEIDLDRRTLRHSGVGNVAGAVLADGASRSLVSHNGTVGHEARHFQEFTCPFPAGAVLVMHSDGLASRWSLDPYPGLIARDPALLAGVLYRDFQRGRDDVTVLAVARPRQRTTAMSKATGKPLLTMEIRLEHDVVLVRQRRGRSPACWASRRRIRRASPRPSPRSRNAFQYARSGKVEFLVDEQAPAAFLIRVVDHGPGIVDLQAILDGRYTSPTGMGVGLVGARRLMDRFEIEAAVGAGTMVLLGKFLSRRAPALVPTTFARIADELARRGPQDPLEEVRRQNQELLQTLAELSQRQEELTQLNRELGDTNRGVVALYAELDEKADYLRRASEMKSRFLSNMSHEFRTPLNSILSLTRILLDRMDGDLTAEQEKQVNFIRKGAADLSELVNDLLDLAKVEAGKVVLRPQEFEASALFGALRGMLRPLLAHNPSVSLVFEEPDGLGKLNTDEGKVSQVPRNFISNALKFTEQGEVRVTASAGPEDTVVFAVADTGIGVALEDQEAIFQEFTQIDSARQKRVKGTGLGLPLSRKLGELLGGVRHAEKRAGTGIDVLADRPPRLPGAGRGGVRARGQPGGGPDAPARRGGRRQPGDAVHLRKIPERVGIPGGAGALRPGGAARAEGAAPRRRGAGHLAGGGKHLGADRRLEAPAADAQPSLVGGDDGGQPAQGAGAGGRRLLRQARGPGLAAGQAP